MRLTTFFATLALLGVAVDASTSKCGNAAVARKNKSRNATAKTSHSKALTAHGKNRNATVKISSTTKVHGNVTKASSSSNSCPGLTANGVCLGFLPDEGDAGGQRQSLTQLNKLMGAKASNYGWYAQAQSGTTFTGSQILPLLDEVKSTGAIFEATVMPTGGWGGLVAGDNSQAVAICNVMKKFTDAGIETRLRFGHEVNYYQTDGTYQGNAGNFKAGWDAVGQACRKIAPDVKLWFTPNVANEAQYDEYFPDDPSLVDLIGIDFYPRSLGATTFVDAMKSFHDKYTTGKYSHIKFAIGETGLGFAGSIQQRVQWLEQITSPATIKALPNLISCSWFNFQKGYDFMLVNPGNSADTAAFKAAFVK